MQPVLSSPCCQDIVTSSCMFIEQVGTPRYCRVVVCNAVWKQSTDPPSRISCESIETRTPQMQNPKHRRHPHLQIHVLVSQVQATALYFTVVPANAHKAHMPTPAGIAPGRPHRGDRTGGTTTSSPGSRSCSPHSTGNPTPLTFLLGSQTILAGRASTVAAGERPISNALRPKKRVDGSYLGSLGRVFVPSRP